MEVKKGDILYWARIVKSTSVCEVVELKIRSVYDSWFVGCEDKTRQSFIFKYDDLEKVIFKNRGDALQKVLDFHNASDKIKTIKKEED